MRLKSLTLIELLVAVSISLLLIALSYPIFAKEAGGKSVDKEAESIAAFISRAKNYSYNPEDENATEYSIKIESAKKLTLKKKRGLTTGGIDLPVDELILSKPSISSALVDQIVFLIQDKNAVFKKLGVPQIGNSYDLLVKVNTKTAKIRITKTGNIDVIPN